jgi:hypothetical protein
MQALQASIIDHDDHKKEAAATAGFTIADATEQAKLSLQPQLLLPGGRRCEASSGHGLVSLPCHGLSLAAGLH